MIVCELQLSYVQVRSRFDRYVSRCLVGARDRCSSKVDRGGPSVFTWMPLQTPTSKRCHSSAPPLQTTSTFRDHSCSAVFDFTHKVRLLPRKGKRHATQPCPSRTSSVAFSAAFSAVQVTTVPQKQVIQTHGRDRQRTPGLGLAHRYMYISILSSDIERVVLALNE